MAVLVNRFHVFFLRIMRNKGFAHNVVLLAGSTTLSQGVVMLASPILTRLYTPADFGVLTVYTAILSTLSVVASLRYELAIPLPEDDETAVNLLALSTLIVPTMSLLTGLGVFLLGDQIVHWTNTPALKPYLWLLLPGLLGAGGYQVFNYWAIRKKAFDRIAQTKLSQSLGKVLTQVILGLLELGPVGLLLGNIVGQVSGSGTLAALAYKQNRGALEQINKTRVRWVAQRYRRFPLLSSGSALLNRAGLDLPPLLLAAFYGPQVVGWFGLGRRLIKVPMTLVGRSVAQVYMGESARLAQEAPETLHRLFLKTAQKLLLVGGIPIALLGLSSPWLFALIFGEIWREAGVYVQLLAVMLVAEFVVVPVSSTLNMLEQQNLQLAWDVGRLVLVVSILWLANTMGGSPVQAVGAYSGGMLIAYLGLFGLCNYALAKVASGQDIH
ncbi:MAG: oligosaccharide flippase family protein [Chloroflexota bacterium]|nr:oligosaccharide flippase family protein [Chloroflexota bacterium]